MANKILIDCKIFNSTSSDRSNNLDKRLLLVEKLRLNSEIARFEAKGKELAFQTAAVELALEVLAQEGVTRGAKLQVLPAWSSAWKYGAEFAGVEWGVWDGPLELIGHKLSKDGSRVKGGPWKLGPVAERHKNIYPT